MGASNIARGDHNGKTRILSVGSTNGLAGSRITSDGVVPARCDQFRSVPVTPGGCRARQLREVHGGHHHAGDRGVVGRVLAWKCLRRWSAPKERLCGSSPSCTPTWSWTGSVTTLSVSERKGTQDVKRVAPFRNSWTG